MGCHLFRHNKYRATLGKRSKPRRQSLVPMLFLIVAIFLVCHTPKNILNIYELIIELNKVGIISFYFILYYIIYCSPIVDLPSLACAQWSPPVTLPGGQSLSPSATYS